MDFILCCNAADQPWADWVSWQLSSNDHLVFDLGVDVLAGENWVIAIDNALKTPAKSGDVKRALIILTPNFRIDSIQETAWTSLFRSDPASKERRCIPILAHPTDLSSLPFLANLKPIDLCGCNKAEAQKRLLAEISGKGRLSSEEPWFPGDEPAFPPDQPTRKLETGLADGATAVEPFEVLAALFENPPVSSDELRNICWAALPMPARAQIPSNQSGRPLLQWLLGRGALSNGRIPLLDVIATLVPKVDIGQRQRIFDAKAAIAARFGLQSDAGHSMDRSAPDEATALLVEIWPVAASAPNRCNAQVRWFQGQTARCTDVLERDSALRLDENETVVAFVKKLRQTIGVHRASNDRLIVEFALPKTHLSQPVDRWQDESGDPLGIGWPVVVRSRERLRDSDWQVDWEGNWNALANRFHEILPEPVWWCATEDQRKAASKSREGVCIALAQVPETSVEIKTNLPAYLAYKGAPAVLWVRRKECVEGFRETLEGRLSGKPLGELPKQLRDIRSSMWEDGCEDSTCFHLTLMWDDPARCLEAPTESDDFYQAP